MNDFEKINTDLATLFREGRALLDAGNSAVMNGCREEAFRKFVDLGGIPNKQEDYIYLNLLPLFGKDYNVVLKYIRQEVDMNETFRCAVGGSMGIRQPKYRRKWLSVVCRKRV